MAAHCATARGAAQVGPPPPSSGSGFRGSTGRCTTRLMVVRLGGSSLFQRARPFFIGIIFGEGLAAGFWLLVNAIVVMNGGESQSVKFLL